eukprot:9010180-Pyramimonas_sp.AAC.1
MTPGAASNIGARLWQKAEKSLFADADRLPDERVGTGGASDGASSGAGGSGIPAGGCDVPARGRGGSVSSSIGPASLTLSRVLRCLALLGR